MSFQWIPCTDLTGPKWNYSLSDVFEFVTKGLLTPFDEAGNPLLPGEFVEVLSKTYSVRHGNRLSWDEARINIEKAYDKRRKEYIKGETYLHVTLAETIAAKGHEQASKRALEDNLAKIDEEKNRYVSELLEWERFLTEHSEHPWQSISFTPREYKIELERIAKAFFKEAEVAVLEAKIAVCETNVFSFYKDGDMWLIGRCGHEAKLLHSKGLERIHFLLSRPGEEIYFADFPGNLRAGRSSISEDLKTTIERIRREYFCIAEYLSIAITTGNYLKYDHSPKVKWVLERPS